MSMCTTVYVVRRVAKRFGMKVCSDEEADWTIYWTDTVLPEKLSEMKIYQVYMQVASCLGFILFLQIYLPESKSFSWNE